jgi:predicted nucleotidyltransferase
MRAPDQRRFGLKPEVIEALHTVFSQFPEIDSVWVYRSCAKGDFRPGSDIDLTIKLVPGVSPPSTFLSKIRDNLEDLNLIYMIDLSLYNEIENAELIDHIDRVGVRL